MDLVLRHSAHWHGLLYVDQVSGGFIFHDTDILALPLHGMSLVVVVVLPVPLWHLEMIVGLIYSDLSLGVNRRWR